MMRRTIGTFAKAAGLLGTLAALPATALAQPVVPVAQGSLQGQDLGEVVVFKGIPYASAPVGENRWRAPQEPASWDGVRDATSFGADCAQAPFPPDAAPIETAPAEDCLFLNVWAPETARAGAGLPVMVWIHGGGFVNGGSSPAVYSGENFARDGLVFVSLNYRLGRYGFFAHPALAEEGFGGNFGFLDQIAALEWVRDNIAAFGGNPQDVTVFGESAGGMSVHMLLQSPRARGLFDKAIIQSGGGRERVPPMPTIAMAARAGAAFAPGLSAAELRRLPEERVTGDLSMMTMDRPDFSGPMIDGVTVLGASIEAARAGLYAEVPVMIGANSADGFASETDKDKVFVQFGADEAEARRLYDPDGSTDGLEVATMISADQMFIEPARAIARALAPRQPVYLYRFGYAVPEWQDSFGGTPHAAEIPYVFDTLAARREPPMTAGEAEIAALAHRYWVTFAKTGSPDAHGGVPAWPAATPETRMVQLLDGGGARQQEDPYAARLDFVERRAAR